MTGTSLQTRAFRALLPMLTATLLLAACAGRPHPQPQQLPGTLHITSAATSTSRNYVLTGDFDLPGSQTGELEYSLNDGDWQPVDMRSGGFSISLRLEEGQNKLAVALTTGGQRTQQEFVVTVSLPSGGDGGGDGDGDSGDDDGDVDNDGPPAPPDTQAPQFILTSAEQVRNPLYTLTGAALDDTGVSAVSYFLNADEAAPIPLNSLGMFTVDLLLQAGENHISLSAQDAAGNTGNAQLTVRYIPPFEAVTVDPMIAMAGETVTIQGRNFGTAEGVVRLGTTALQVDDWNDTAVTFTVPAGVNGWHDLDIWNDDNRLTVPGFFAGREIADSDALNDWLLSRAHHGTALLLSGDSYTIDLGSNSVDLHGGYSLFGAPTDAGPTTTVELANIQVLVSLDRRYGMQYQDIEILLHEDLQFWERPQTEGASVTTSFPAGIGLTNVTFSRAPGGHERPLLSFGEQGIDELMPGGAVRLQQVTTGDLGLIFVSGSQVAIESSELRSNASIVYSERLPLQVHDTRIVAPDLATSRHAQLIASAGSELSGVTVDATSFWLDLYGGSATLEASSVRADTVRIRPEGHLQLMSNRLEIAGSITVIRPGELTVDDNDFVFSDSNPDTIPFSFAPDEGEPKLVFTGNSTAGRNRLFSFSGVRGAVDAEIEGNVFDANLTLPGDVAVLAGINAPASIRTRANQWGHLTAADQVLALISYLAGSAPGSMTVEPF